MEGRTRVVPGQQLREERVVVRQGLASSSGLRGRLSGAGQGRELVGSLSMLVLDVLSNWA